MIRKALLALTAVSAMTLAGCEIYLGPPADPSPPGCEPWGCDVPPPGDPGGYCQINEDCAAGCYCNDDNWCEETGFCDDTWQCQPGYVCDDRATCVPENTGPIRCGSNEECPAGSFCLPELGECIPSWTCWSDEECGPGMMCDDRGTCVPAPCDDDYDCAGGCYCDVETGTCVETGFCENDNQCTDGMVCDQERFTCVPPDSQPPNPGNCYEEVLCDGLPPDCPDDSVPGVSDGCYTGACIPLGECEEPPVPACEEIETEDECFDRADCTPTYVGVNCTCADGEPCRCSADDASCTCERYDFAGCLTL